MSEMDGLYVDACGQPVLRESIVLYVDELGTAASLAKMTDADLSSVLQDHSDVGWFLHSTDMDEFQRSAPFSDNTVVGAPLTDADDGGAFPQVFSAATYQLNLAVRGRFLRGALATGPLYIADGFVTGQGLVDAVKLEENEAVFPRVIIQRKLWYGFIRESLPYADPYTSPENRYVLLDADGELFVNYLGALSEDDYEGAVENGLQLHRDVVAAKLDEYRTNERVRRKYAWVALYHNWICSEAFYNLPDLMIIDGLDHLEQMYGREMSLLIPQPGIWNGQPGRPPA